MITANQIGAAIGTAVGTSVASACWAWLIKLWPVAAFQDWAYGEIWICLMTAMVVIHTGVKSAILDAKSAQ